MSGPNITGFSQPRDLRVGRGRINLASLDANDNPLAYRFVGNCTESTYTTETETLEHRSSISGLKTIDREVTISQDVLVNFTLDEYNDENLALFFAGSKATHTNVAVAGFSEFTMVSATSLSLGSYYAIVNASGARAYGVAPADLSIETTNSTPVPLVAGTDYVLDAISGMIHILSTSTVVATAISGNEGLAVTLAANAGAEGVDEVRGLTTTGTSVAMQFLAANAADNDNISEIMVHKIQLKGEGDAGFISDEFAVLNFSGRAEKSVLASPNSPTITIRNLRGQA